MGEKQFLEISSNHAEERPREFVSAALGFIHCKSKMGAAKVSPGVVSTRNRQKLVENKKVSLRYM